MAQAEGEHETGGGEPALTGAEQGSRAESGGPTGPLSQEASYETAVSRLEAIIERLDSGKAGLRETLELCREGRDLVVFCAKELDEVGADLKELRLDELASGLEPREEG